MKCTLLRTGEVLAGEIEMADTFFTRLKGLMLRAGLPAGKALLLVPCPQIHTCFMRFEIDAVFCNKDGEVLYIIEHMKPWRFGKFVRGARWTLEFKGGSLAGRVKTGDKLSVE
jgi:hypothetical protein